MSDENEDMQILHYENGVVQVKFTDQQGITNYAQYDPNQPHVMAIGTPEHLTVICQEQLVELLPVLFYFIEHREFPPKTNVKPLTIFR